MKCRTLPDGPTQGSNTVKAILSSIAVLGLVAFGAAATAQGGVQTGKSFDVARDCHVQGYPWVDMPAMPRPDCRVS